MSHLPVQLIKYRLSYTVVNPIKFVSSSQLLSSCIALAFADTMGRDKGSELRMATSSLIAVELPFSMTKDDNYDNDREEEASGRRRRSDPN